MSIDSVLLIIRNTQKHFIHPLVRLGINKSRDIKSMHYTGVKMNELQYVPKCYHLYRKKKKQLTMLCIICQCASTWYRHIHENNDTNDKNCYL